MNLFKSLCRRTAIICLLIYPLVPSSMRADDQLISQALMEQFLMPIKHLHRDTFDNFLMGTFNHPAYTYNFLPRCMAHITDMLSLGRGIKQESEFVESVFSLFHLKLKECTWINDRALAQLFEQFPDLLAPAFAQARNVPVQVIEERLAQELAMGTPADADEAQKYFGELAKRIVADLDACTVGSYQSLRTTFLRFVEGACDRVIWDPGEGIQTWQSFKDLVAKTQHLHALGYLGDEDALNSVLWSLSARYVYFIQSCGSNLSDECLSQIISELALNSVDALKIAEQEGAMTSKHHLLARTVDVCIKQRQLSEKVHSSISSSESPDAAPTEQVI